MRNVILRVAALSALAVPLTVAGMGIASAAPVLEPGPAATVDGQLKAVPGETWFCYINSPGFGYVTSTMGPAVILPPPAAAGLVGGMCAGSGGIAPLTGTTG